jgi:hypothetical protein
MAGPSGATCQSAPGGGEVVGPPAGHNAGRGRRQSQA